MWILIKSLGILKKSKICEYNLKLFFKTYEQDVINFDLIAYLTQNS